MTPIETLLTIQQFANMVTVHQHYGKVIDAAMQECYNSCAFKDEALSGSLNVFPPWMQEKHSSKM